MHYTPAVPMKRIRILFIALAALLILVVMAGTKRVPTGSEAVLVSKNGSVRVLAAGWHWVGPGGKLVRYPSGEQSYRVPEKGMLPVIFQNGDSLAVAYQFDLKFPAGSAEALYQKFTADFPTAFTRLVTSVAEIEAASRPSRDQSGDMDASVVDRVRDELQTVGVEVR